ncbi:MAG: peptidylprolyl isomerase [Myxococcota bacterium]
MQRESHQAPQLKKVVVQLHWQKAPLTCLNFVALAKGSRPWTDPVTGESRPRPLYAQVPFHRVIPDFMIQGGDPMGNGMGGPGYSFPDEFHPQLRHDAEGILSMANAGPNSNGSQFFITVTATPHLDNRHAVFGKVVQGMDVVHDIVQLPRDVRDRPLEEVMLTKVKVKRVVSSGKG